VLLFDEGKQEYRRQRAELGEGCYDGFLTWEVNNARLLSYRRYNSHFDRFEVVLERLDGDLAATVRQFVTCGEAQDPWTCIGEDDTE
jgi:predicted aminopeptidase